MRISDHGHTTIFDRSRTHRETRQIIDEIEVDASAFRREPLVNRLRKTRRKIRPESLIRFAFFFVRVIVDGIMPGDSQVLFTKDERS